MKISICIPVYNGSKSIEHLVSEIGAQLSMYDLQFVLVNDASKDNSDEILSKMALENDKIISISLRKNYGEHNAVLCALNHATGDYAVIIDDDFQNPPSEIIKLIKEADAGKFDVVYSKYLKKEHHLFRNIGSKFNDLMANLLLKKPKNLYLSSFKIIARDVVQEIIKYKGPYPYIDGLILRVTDNIGSVIVEHSKRDCGKSNYTIYKLISLWLNMFINFSVRPLRFFTIFGILSSLIGFTLIIIFAIEKMFYPQVPIGWTATISTILLFSGIQLIFLGLIGEYLGKLYLDQNKTPQWTIKKITTKG